MIYSIYIYIYKEKYGLGVLGGMQFGGIFTCHVPFGHMYLMLLFQMIPSLIAPNSCPTYKYRASNCY